MSLGGSLIVPRDVDIGFLDKFKKILGKHRAKTRFVVVCGGGVIARKYISLLKKQKKSLREQALAGIRATRMNAELLMQVFDEGANKALPKSMKDVENLLRKNDFVFCGALRYAPEETSDGTAAKLAKRFGVDLINITNVDGLFDGDPRINKKVKLIDRISWKDFEAKAMKIKFKPGQHFVLDQNAAKFIRKNCIRTFIVGKRLGNLNRLLKGKSFKGTRIEG